MLTLTLTLMLTLMLTLTLTLTQTLNLTSKCKLWKVLKKVKKKKREVAKVRVELRSNGIPDVKHNYYATSSTPIAWWWTDLFIWIPLCHETECSTGGRIAPADLLPPESWRWNRHYLNWYQSVWSIDIGQGSLTYVASRPNVNPTHRTISFCLVRHFVNYLWNYDISKKNLLI